MLPLALILFAISGARADGPAHLLADIDTTPTLPLFLQSTPPDYDLHYLNGVRGNVFFFVTTEGVESILWRYDGPDSKPVRIAGVPSPHVMAVLGDDLFVVAQSATAGELELRRFESSSATWPPIAKFPAEYATGSVVADGVLFLATAASSGGPAPAIWRSDGTSAGTIKIADREASDLVEVGGMLYFVSSSQLWASDGTPFGEEALAPAWRIVGSASGLTYFTVDGRDLWRSDGTPSDVPMSGTVLVRDFGDDEADSIAAVVEVNGAAIAVTSLGASTGLWRTDGTPAGTTLVTEIPRSTRFGASGIAVDDAHTLVLLSTAGTGSTGQIWRTDGTADGTAPITELPCVRAFSISLCPLPQFAGTRWIFLGANRLWTSDATAEGTQPIEVETGATLGSSPSTFVQLHEQATVFIAEGELWVTDGTELGTRPLTAGHDSTVRWIDSSMHVVGNRVFVLENTANALWMSDGTPQGTKVVASPLPSWQFFTDFGSWNDGFFASVYRGDGEQGGYSLWRIDGAATGADFISDAASVFGFVAAGPRLYFLTRGEMANQIWTSDGSAPGTRPVERIVPVSRLLALGDAVYVLARVAADMVQLVRIGVEGASPVTLALPDVTPTSVRMLTADDELVYFVTGLQGDAGTRLWRSDGTDDGTFVVGEFPTMDVFGGGSLFSGLNVVAGSRGLLFFNVHSDLWRTDGTVAGTFLLKREVAATPVLDAGDRLVFGAHDGRELWASDGSRLGTTRIQDLTPGVIEGEMELAGAHAIFTMYHPSYGREPWVLPLSALDGTGAGCAGDCEGDGSVSTGELVGIVRAMLSGLSSDACTRGDVDGDGRFSVDELVAAVDAALTGCEEEAS